jgi:hypothetical protein
MNLKHYTREAFTMKTNSHQLNWIVDASLFTGFWLASLLDLTGLAVHEWLGLAVGILAGYHLLAHWTWVKSVTQRLFGHTSPQAQRFYMIDAGLLAGFSLILLTGLAISTWLDLTLANYAAWHTIHVMATLIALGLLVIKIGLHWRWVYKVGQQIFDANSRLEKRQLNPQALPAIANTERRDFLKLMGVVSIAALIATYSAIESDESTQYTGSSQGNTNQRSSESASIPDTYGSSNSSRLGSICCNKGCSYPGHCRRYVDSNSNGRCDLGECQI